MNVPLIITCGNHDQKLLSPWYYFFGSINTITKFDNLHLITFDSSLPISSNMMNWIDNGLKDIPESHPKFIICHYPPHVDYFSYGWLGITNLAMQYNVKAILAGHYHLDFISYIKDLQEAILNYKTDQNIESFEIIKSIQSKFDSTFNYSDVIKEPLLILTRSGAKGGYVLGNETSPKYSGYRRFIVANDEIYNFTYDYNGNGMPDPQVCVPNGRFNTNLTFNSGKWTLTLNSSFNENIISARGVFKIPSPNNEYKWDLVPENKTNGAYIRAYLDDGVNCYIDTRVYIPKNSIINLQIEEVAL